MSYPQDPQGWQRPGGYDPNAGGYDPNAGGYGDPYAQPPGGYQAPYDPATGQPQPTSGNPQAAPPAGPLPPGYEYGQPSYPAAPTSGYPGAPTSGYPGAPTSGYPGAPTSGYPGAPTSGYPGAPTSGYPGYPTTGYPGATGYPPVPPPKKSRAGLIIGIVAGVLVLLIAVISLGVWALWPEDDPIPIASASSSPTPSASPSPSDPPLLAQFNDPDLRDFARKAAAIADRCEVITTSIPAANNAAEAVKCSFPSQFQVYFLRYKTLADRDSYAQSARTGFSDDSVVIDGDTFWTDDTQTRQGTYITGYGKTDNSRYLYWDVPGIPVSGEVYTPSTDSLSAETFWKKIR